MREATLRSTEIQAIAIFCGGHKAPSSQNLIPFYLNSAVGGQLAGQVLTLWVR